MRVNIVFCLINRNLIATGIRFIPRPPPRPGPASCACKPKRPPWHQADLMILSALAFHGVASPIDTPGQGDRDRRTQVQAQPKHSTFNAAGRHPVHPRPPRRPLGLAMVEPRPQIRLQLRRPPGHARAWQQAGPWPRNTPAEAKPKTTGLWLWLVFAPAIPRMRSPAHTGTLVAREALTYGCASARQGAYCANIPQERDLHEPCATPYCLHRFYV